MSKTRKPVSPDAVAIGTRIRDTRKTAGLSQEQLGVLLGITGVMVLAYEKGRSRISTELLGRIAEITGVTMAFLLTGNIPEEQRKAHTDIELEALETFRRLPPDKQEKALEAFKAIVGVITET
ncbi:helix-turn-helix domain-containing protein [Komagataeibacter oboediens]|uniref:helix-turn-helix domain-containing protein n=1 Tax=Komagataeibacter oboediens TaxID=65958 RepID=UPI0019052CFC|nr:helix-turn-helix transcriptional regulator [Komagataeibacter oboediens]